MKALVLMLLATLAPSPVSIRMSPQAGIVPVTAAITATVERNEENRTLCLVWGVGEMVNSSCQTLNGAGEPRTFRFERTFREAGEYTVRIEVRQASGKLLSDSLIFQAIGRD